MKKLVLIMCGISLVFMCGCGRKVGEHYTETERFAIVSGVGTMAPYSETIIVDEETGVMYLVVYAYNHFGITPLLNADGKPMLAEEGE